jgi:predicted ArsR family transcriptional regulator
MTGMTISEMAKKLNLEPDTVRRRLQRAGRKPFCQEALYTTEDFEAIKNSPGKGYPKGRSRKNTEPQPTKKPRK